MPFFSIIIPTFNRVLVLPRALESIINQSFSDWELIVVDDGSTDNTVNILESFVKDKRIKYIRQENRGVCVARNLGSEKASGSYICFLDSDDYVSESWLIDFYNEIMKSKADIVRCKTLVNNIPEKNDYILLAGNFSVKRDLFLEAGKYDVNLKFGENTELKWRLDKSKPKVSNISNCNFFYENDLTNNSNRKKENQVEFTYYVLNKHYDLLKKKKRWLQIVYQIAGVNCLQLGRIREGKKLIWKGYLSYPVNFKSLVRAIRYSFRFSKSIHCI
jgi:glycosyltransferase involved in cell wall biosynthesis